MGAMTHDNSKSKTTATSNCLGINNDLSTCKWIKQTGQAPARCKLRRASYEFQAFFHGVLLYAVMRIAESIIGLEEMGTRSQASTLIPWCSVTAVSASGACGCRYPILHLCNSAPTDQQSNFTQVCSEGGNACVGMRIYASKTRSYLKKLREWWTEGKK